MEKGEHCEDVPDAMTLFIFFHQFFLWATVTTCNLLLKNSGQQQQEIPPGFPPAVVTGVHFYPETGAVHQVCAPR